MRLENICQKEKQKDENRPFLDFGVDSKGSINISVKLLIIS
jgi:hypothetical protein